MINYRDLLDQIKHYVVNFYENHPSEVFVYHNLSHTLDVIKAIQQIGAHYQLGESDSFIVDAAGWFHDLGYYSSLENHEERGAAMAEDFLLQKEVDRETVAAIKSCILATRLPQSPHTLNEQIVCDADLFHLGTSDFKEKNKRMYAEYEAVKGVKIKKSQWRKSTIALFEQHHYHTDYCRKVLEEGKTLNLQSLKEKEAEDKVDRKGKVESREKEVSGEKKKMDSRPNRGIETMFRISSGNHQRLSDMADNKAHILITVNSIILSAIISLLLRRLEDHIYLAVPTFMMLTVSVLTIIYSILATRPSIPAGTFTQKEIDEKTVNLLFFGNFYKMSLDEYSQGMWKTMEDKSFLYGSLIRDVYSQGVVLGRKYRLLRVAYNIFMFGLVITVFGFIIASMIHGKD